jgi:methylated-DNA-[protein]-cysteine S-methyltransferase
MSTLTYYVTATPLGPFALLAEGASVHAAGFSRSAQQLAKLAKADGAVIPVLDDHPALGAVRAYFAGDLTAIEAVEVHQQPDSTPFRESARAALRRIPAGTTATYAELAAHAGSARASRAAGSACATNPTLLFVPCHRVLRSDGSLGGFRDGLAVKRALLEHERTAAAPGSRANPAPSVPTQSVA